MREKDGGQREGMPEEFPRLGEEEWDLLPDTAQQLARLLGLDAALNLVRDMGGRTVRVPHGHTARGRAVLAELARCVGEDGARALAREYAATQLYIPRCTRAFVALRNAALARDHEQWSGQGFSERGTVSRLSARYGISDRYVWRILKETPVQPAGKSRYGHRARPWQDEWRQDEPPAGTDKGLRCAPGVC